MKVLNFISIIFIPVLLINIPACSKQDDDTTDKPLVRPVRTMTVGLPNEANWREFPGVVDAVQTADLTFRVKGKLTKLYANEGDVVSQAQVVAQLDQAEYNIQLSSRQAEYEKANADYKRGQDLVKKGVISRADFDQLKASNTTARANLETAQQNLKYTQLKAPFKGRISKRHIENYEEVNSSQIIYTLQDISSLTVKVDVPESVMIGLRQDVKPVIQAYFAEITDTSFPLSLKEVSTQADKDTKTFEVTFEMPQVKNYTILPGMSVTVRGKPGDKAEVTNKHIYIPAHSVLDDQTGRYIYIAEPQEDSLAIVRRKNVKTGKLSSQGIRIMSGLRPGERVIIAGMSKMRVGLQVRLMDGSSP